MVVGCRTQAPAPSKSALPRAASSWRIAATGIPWLKSGRCPRKYFGSPLWWRATHCQSGPKQGEPEDPGSVVYALTPKRAFAWRESDYPESATRFTF